MAKLVEAFAETEQIELPIESDVSARATTPWIFSRRSPLKPTAVFDTYWRFAAKRQDVFFRRLEGTPEPWSDDPILQRHKFTNAYRASDRASQYLIENVIYAGDQSAIEVFFRTLLFKLFNKIDTWLLLQREFGELRSETFDEAKASEALKAAIQRGERIYSAAYIMPPAAAFAGNNKHDSHLALLRHMLQTGAPERVVTAATMKDAFQVLKGYSGLGDFLAYQFTIDLNYSECIAFGENDFVVPGPGARDGVRKCFSDLGGLCEADVIRVMVDQQQAQFERLELEFRDLWGRPLHSIDCQNLFCEVDKYARVAHPDALGISGRTRIKQQFRALERMKRFVYPRKWGLPAHVSADVEIV